MYGTVASFSVLVQSFYKICQDQNEKISTYTTMIEGALNQIRLKYQNRLHSEAIEGVFREGLFHGMKKRIRNLLGYLYDNPSVGYTQLVVSTQKNECKQSEARDEK